MRTTWALLIPDYWPPSLNNVTHAHWSRTRQHKKQAIKKVFLFGNEAGGLPQFAGKVCVELYRFLGRRSKMMDRDNLEGSVKPLIDAMRASKAAPGSIPTGSEGGLGIFEDDCPSLLGLHVSQVDRVEVQRAILDKSGAPQRWFTPGKLACLIVVTGEEK